MRPALVTLLALLVCIAATTAEAAERRVALVVGNGAYAETSAALPNPANDARAVAGALRGLGFEVIEAVDLDHGRLRATLGEFARRLEGAQAGLFFYAGHGLQIRGRNYLVPVDARLEREADAYVQALALDDVLRLMETAVPTRLVLLDACRNNPFTRSLARAAAGGTRGAMVEPGLAKVEATAGTLIAYATAPDEVALDGAGRNSPFTAALMEYVGAPGLEARQVLTRVRGRVMAATNGQQVPWDSSSLTGDFYFNPTVNIDTREEEEREPAPAPAPTFDRDSLFWQSVQASDDPADLEAYLAQFPDGIYAALARNRLTRLKAPQQAALPPVTQAPPPPIITEPERPPTAAPVASPEAIEAALGLSREDWRRLQAALTALGFDTRGTDGRPGPNTRKAIAAWQRGEGQEPTGYFAGLLQRDLLLSEAGPTRALIAVLPLASLGEAGDGDYFADGLTEDVISALGRFGDIAVISPAGVFAYKGESPTPEQVGRDLHVRYVVEGSVRRSPERVRVAITLTDTARGTVLWSERYDAKPEDIFSVQDEITHRISGALAVRVSSLELARAAAKPPDNLEAHDLVLRGRDLLSRGKRSSNAEARALFERAIEIDPGYAPAYVGLGHVNLAAVTQGWTPDPSGTLERAEGLARRAIELDDLGPRAHALLGNVLASFGEYDRALEELRRAIDLNPSDAEAYRGLVSVLLWTGDTRGAIAAGEFLAQIKPNLSVFEAFYLATAYVLADRSRDAIRVLEQALAHGGTNPAANAMLAAAYAEVGRPDEAERQADVVRRLYPAFPREEFGSQLRDRGQRERLALALSKAGL